MYEKFFQFRDRPFQLVPNPAYLFLSKGHEEALAHLSYAIMHGDGFVVITGEVGTGKTTLCRYFLDELGGDTEAAYVFNPKLDCLQLLKVINDEFEVCSQADTIKDLIDRLNDFLIAKKTEGKRVVLLIDEAQNLSMDVLEQLRLLSNLETNTSKLLQIILVGQPELDEMICSHALRQLAQRITLHYRLPPLTRKETAAYISHRLHIASNRTAVHFTHSALRSIYLYSGGTPRLINIICDRALLTAFSNNQHEISRAIVNSAINELHIRSQDGRILGKTYVFAGAALTLTVLLGMVCYQYDPSWLSFLLTHETIVAKETSLPQNGQPVSEPLPSFSPVLTTAAGQPQQADQDHEDVLPLTKVPAGALADFLLSVSAQNTRSMAMSAVLQKWLPHGTAVSELPAEKSSEAMFKQAAERYGLNVLRVDRDFSLIQQLNLPAVMEFYHQDAPVIRYLALAGKDNNGYLLQGGETILPASTQDILRFWTGIAYIPWKDFLSLSGNIPGDAPAQSVFLLKMLLREAGHSSLPLTGQYDARTQEVVQQIQAKYGLKDDGVVGPRTKILLYNLARTVETPKVDKEQVRSMD